jgi:hypothetical protein
MQKTDVWFGRCLKEKKSFKYEGSVCLAAPEWPFRGA